MAEKPKKSTFQKVLDILGANPGCQMEVGAIRKCGKWTEKESQNLGITLANLHTAGKVGRIRRTEDGDKPGRGRPSYLYHIAGADTQRPAKAASSPKTTVCPSPAVKPLKQDLAAAALASPPRGRSAEVPSLASASLPAPPEAAPVRHLGPAVEVAPVTYAKRDETIDTPAPWYVVAVSPRFEDLAKAKAYALNIAENETDVEVVIGRPVEVLRLVPQWERA